MARLRYPGGDPENGPAFDPEAVDANGHHMFDDFGNRVYHRKDGTQYSGPNWRKVKRYENSYDIWHPVLEAQDRGEHAAHLSGPRMQNPYPPGRRHDAFEHGYNTADPLFDYYGPNH